MLAFMTAALIAAPDVFFISVDTLRADHLGCYGYSIPTSPELDALAGQSLLFEDAVCEVPLTAPSFCSMLTSQYPRTTGITRNGLRLADDVPTVPEQFNAAGYQTFCVQSNWTLKQELSGLNRGFDTYDDEFHKRRWGFIKSERAADEVTRIALDLLSKRDPDVPLFAWVHYSDPHAPYKYHRKFDPRKQPGVHEDKASENWERRRKGVVKKYDSEIAFADHEIGRLLDALPADAYILFVADHGESLYEHDYLGHGRRIYQTGLHIPLMVRGPNVTPGRTTKPARGVDVGATLLAMAGLSPEEGMLGLNLLDEALPETRTRVVETYGGAVPQIWGAKALMADAPPQWQGVLAGGWKLIVNESDTELYHVADDPMEEKNLASGDGDRVRDLNALIDAWDSSTSKASGEEVTLTDEDRRALDNLGYLE